MNNPQFLKPEDIHPFHAGYPGPYMIGIKHIKRIFPGWEDPELTEELERIRGPGRLQHWGTMDPPEANTLIGIIKALQPEAVFEIGTAEGLLTKYIAEATSVHAKVHTVNNHPS